MWTIVCNTGSLSQASDQNALVHLGPSLTGQVIVCSLVTCIESQNAIY